jgi:hypothetical protein
MDLGDHRTWEITGPAWQAAYPSSATVNRE